MLISIYFSKQSMAHLGGRENLRSESQITSQGRPPPCVLSPDCSDSEIPTKGWLWVLTVPFASVQHMW